MKKIIKKLFLEEIGKDNLIGYNDVIKTEFGQIEIYVTNHIDDGIDIIHFNKVIPIITGIFLYDQNNKNLGYGKQLYLLSLKKYNKVYSVFPISTEAFNVRKSLIKNGLVDDGFESFDNIDFLTMELKNDEKKF